MRHSRLTRTLLIQQFWTRPNEGTDVRPEPEPETILGFLIINDVGLVVHAPGVRTHECTYTCAHT